MISVIGAEKSTEWVNERLLSIINTRMMKGLSTIYTSNCSLDDIGKRMGERIRSRIRGSVTEIQYIRTLEHNYNVAVDFNIQQVKNFQRMEDRIVKELEGCSIVMSTESVPHRYFKAVSVKRAVDIVRRGGVSHGSK